MKKKLILFLVLLTISLGTGYSQSVNGKPLSKIDVEYVQIVGIAKAFSTKLSVRIDFGQESKSFSSKQTQIRDRKGKAKIFNSMIDALNFMNKNGYDFVQAYTATFNNQNEHYYLLRKRNKDTAEE